MYAWVVTGLRPFTVPALVATLAGGAAVILVGQRLLPPVAGREPVNGVWAWAVVVTAAALWELQAFVQHPRSHHPTISSLSNELLRSHVPRAGAMVVWLAAGVWLARRRTATLGQAVIRVMHGRAGRVVVLGAWLWTGWHIFVRRSS